ncbi:MAG: class I SAM-dependent methyltransferase, partial [Thermoleophilia bacterium]
MPTLRDYFDAKYAVEPARTAGLTRVTDRPRDRFEAVVSLAWPGGDALLEVGAGSGAVLRTLRPRYRRCVATELSHPRAEYLRELFKGDSTVEVCEGPIEEGPPPDGPFDAIVLNAVVAQLVDPISVLKMLGERLTPSGRLIVTTPNLAKWTRRVKLGVGRFPSIGSRNEGLTDYDGRPTLLYDEGHLHYFTYRSLTMILRDR